MKAFWHSWVVLWLILLIGVGVRMGFYSFLAPYAFHPDSHTYHEAAQRDFWRGEVDPVRTPVLPLMMKFWGGVVALGDAPSKEEDGASDGGVNNSEVTDEIGSDYSTNSTDQVNRLVVATQEVLFVISSVVLWVTLKKILRHNWLPAAVTLFYSVSPVFYNYNYAILTESLAMSLGLVWLCGLIAYARAPRRWLTVMINGLALVLIMLRPAFIFLLPWLGGFWLVRWLGGAEGRKVERQGAAKKSQMGAARQDQPKATKGKKFSWTPATSRELLWGGIGTLVVALSVLGYTQLVANTNGGVRTISKISGLNKVHVVVQYGLHHLSTDTELTAAIDRQLELHAGDLWPTTDYLYDHYAEGRVADYANQVIARHPGQYGGAALKKLGRQAGIAAGSFYAQPLKPEQASLFANIVEVMWPVRLGYIYILLVATGGYVGWQIIGRRRADEVMIITATLIAGQIAVMALGGQSEWSRIIMPALPAVLILLTVWVDRVRIEGEEGEKILTG